MGRTQVALGACLVASAALLMSCKQNSKPKKPVGPQVSAQDAQLATAQGFFLQDGKSLSGHLVRLVRGAELFSPSVGHGVLLSDSAALVPGFDCSGEGLSLVFSVQSNEPPETAAQFGGVVRPVEKCETFEQVASRKETGDGAEAELVAIARAVREAADGFALARVQFSGGLPEGKEPKWAPLAPHDGEGASLAEGFAAWRQLAGKFVYMAGFTRDLQSALGPSARRIWLPYRVIKPSTENEAQLIVLESSFSEGNRSPIASSESWAEGPDKHFFPGFVFSGVARFPNVRAFTEIEPTSPELLCFVVEWKDSPDLPIGSRFSPQCLSAAPFVALMK
jgi:hypothetical protein